MEPIYNFGPQGADELGVGLSLSYLPWFSGPFGLDDKAARQKPTQVRIRNMRPLLTLSQ